MSYRMSSSDLSQRFSSMSVSHTPNRRQLPSTVQPFDERMYDTVYQTDLFMGEVADEFKCSVCLCVMKEAQQIDVCQHMFCKTCITNCLQPPAKKVCPLDRTPITMDNVGPAPRALTTLIKRLMAKCHYHEDGCKVKVPLAELETHESSCSYRSCLEDSLRGRSTPTVAVARINLMVRMADISRTIDIVAHPSDTVLEVKRKIQEKVGPGVTGNVLNYKSKTLEDNKTLKDYNIRDQSTLFTTRRFNGGFE